MGMRAPIALCTSLTLVLTLVVSGLVRVTPAHACLNGTIMEEDEIVKKVRMAEKALESDNPRKALRLLDADHFMTDSNALMTKVITVRAVAQLRVGKVKRAAKVLRNLLKHDKDSPLLKARLAEALHKQRGDEAVEAWTIMDDLESRDLVPDARAYAVLAVLRARAKDAQGEKRALDRCREMAGKQQSICS